MGMDKRISVLAVRFRGDVGNRRLESHANTRVGSCPTERHNSTACYCSMHALHAAQKNDDCLYSVRQTSLCPRHRRLSVPDRRLSVPDSLASSLRLQQSRV